MTSVFDIRHTRAYAALVVRKVVFGLYAVIVVMLALLPLLKEENITQNPLPLLTATALLVWIAFVIESFRRRKLKKSTPNEHPENIAELLSYHMVLHLSRKTTVSAETLLEAATESRRGLFVLQHIGIERSDILAALLKSSEIPLEACLDWCRHSMNELKTTRLDSTATIYAFITNIPVLMALLEKADLSLDDLRKILQAEAFHFELQEKRKHPFSPAMLVRLLGSIGRSWVIGYNTDLERLTKNLSTHILSHERAVVVHQDIINNAVKILQSGLQANILLIGPSGTGKRTLVENIAYTMRQQELRSTALFSDVLLLKTGLLLSGSNHSDQILLHALNNTKEGGKFILVIEDIAMLLKAADAKLKDILINILESKNIRTICIANSGDYSALIKTDSGLDHLLQKTFVEDTDDEETMAVLLEEYFRMESMRRVRITYKALKTLLALCKRYIGKGGMPGIATEVLEEALLTARSTTTKIVTEDSVRAILSSRTRVDVSMLTDYGKEKLMHLKESLQKDIVGQEHAIDCLVAALKRGRLNIGSGKRPIGTFLFLGTTGLGKTETAKALAKEYFGGTEHMIRIDLNEYSNESSIPLLIGGQTEHGFTEGLLTKKIQEQPASIVLLDEIEKAHPKILNLFLQILDEGTLTSGDGEKTDFKSTIIIATSNAGSSWMAEHTTLQEDQAREDFRKALLETVISERTFSPEFINRFDEVIVFTQPSTDEVKQLAILMLGEVIQRFMKDRGIRLTIAPDVLDLLVAKGFSPKYGAREMRRTITQIIENYLADYLLSHTVGRGGEIAIEGRDLEKR
ncbi:ATP-dependent Clp protease ATP-binding subunit [Candidatus Peribacteria bacterium]|nr:ATP-dependent Clp protease ATP-binding subunit [Candidatus Peribacteria bacterium]